VTLATGK